MRFSICIDAVFGDRDLSTALGTVADLGFEAFEFWGWWDKDLDTLRLTKERLRLDVAACCTRFISLVDPGLRGAYLAGLRESLAVAQRLDCPTLISQVGNALPGVPRDVQRESLVAGLRAAVPLLKEAGVTLAFEPLNTKIDHPGYYLTHADEAFAVAAAVGSERVRVLYDIYHQQVTEGDLTRTLTANVARIAHVHAAGHPGRHELDHGEIHYPDLLAALDTAGYPGWIGIEYFPTVDPATWLPTLQSWRTRARSTPNAPEP